MRYATFEKRLAGEYSEYLQERGEGLLPAEIPSLKKEKMEKRIIKMWSRKEDCPYCGVSCGSRHNKACPIRYKPLGEYRLMRAKHKRDWYSRLTVEQKAEVNRRNEIQRKKRPRFCECGTLLDRRRHKCDECVKKNRLEYQAEYYKKVTIKKRRQKYE